MKLTFNKVNKIHNREQQIYNINNADFDLLPDENTALLSIHERSSDAFLKLASGIHAPTSGKVVRQGLISLPIGESAFFHRELTGEQNIRFIGKIYGQNIQQLINSISDLTELNKELRQKTKSYSPLIRRKIAIATTLSMKLDLYLVKGELHHPQASFNDIIKEQLLEVAKLKKLFIASNNTGYVKHYAQSACVLDHKGKLTYYQNIDDGINKLEQLKKG